VFVCVFVCVCVRVGAGMGMDNTRCIFPSRNLRKASGPRSKIIRDNVSLRIW